MPRAAAGGGRREEGGGVRVTAIFCISRKSLDRIVFDDGRNYYDYE